MSVSFAFAQSNSAISKFVASLSILVDGLSGNATTENLVPDLYKHASAIVDRFAELKAIPIDTRDLKTTMSRDASGRGTVIVFDIKSYTESKRFYLLANYMARYLMSLVSSQTDVANDVAMVKFVLVYLAHEITTLVTTRYASAKDDIDYPIVARLKKLSGSAIIDFAIVDSLFNIVSDGNVVILARLQDDLDKAVPLSIVVMMYKFCLLFVKYQDFKLLLESLPQTTLQNFGAATQSKEFEATLAQFLPRFMLSIQQYLATNVRVDRVLTTAVIPKTWIAHTAFLKYLSKMLAHEPMLVSDPSFIWLLDKTNTKTLVGRDKFMALSALPAEQLAERAIVSLEARSSSALNALVLGRIPPASSMLGGGDDETKLELMTSRLKTLSLEDKVKELEKKLADAGKSVVVVPPKAVNVPQIIPSVADVNQFQEQIKYLKEDLSKQTQLVTDEKSRVASLKKDIVELTRLNEKQQLQLDASVTSKGSEVNALADQLVAAQQLNIELTRQFEEKEKQIQQDFQQELNKVLKRERILQIESEERRNKIVNLEGLNKDAQTSFTNQQSVDQRRIEDLTQQNKNLSIQKQELVDRIDAITDERDKSFSKANTLENDLKKCQAELEKQKLAKPIAATPQVSPPSLAIINAPPPSSEQQQKQKDDLVVVKFPIVVPFIEKVYIPLVDTVLVSPLGSGSDASDWNISKKWIESMGGKSKIDFDAKVSQLSSVEKLEYLLPFYDMMFALFKSLFDRGNFRGDRNESNKDFPNRTDVFGSITLGPGWRKNKALLITRLNSFLSTVKPKSKKIRGNIDFDNIFLILSENLIGNNITTPNGDEIANKLFKKLRTVSTNTSPPYIIISQIYEIVRNIREQILENQPGFLIEVHVFFEKSKVFDIETTNVGDKFGASSSMFKSATASSKKQISGIESTYDDDDDNEDDQTMSATKQVSMTLQPVVRPTASNIVTSGPSRAPVSMTMSSHTATTATASVMASSATPLATQMIPRVKLSIVMEALKKKDAGLRSMLVLLSGDLKKKDGILMYDRRELVQLIQQLQSAPNTTIDMLLVISELDLLVKSSKI